MFSRIVQAYLRIASSVTPKAPFQPGDIAVNLAGVPMIAGTDEIGVARWYPSSRTVARDSGTFTGGGGASTDPFIAFDFQFIYDGGTVANSPALGALLSLGWQIPSGADGVVACNLTEGILVQPCPAFSKVSGSLLLKAGLTGRLKGELVLNNGLARVVPGQVSLTVVATDNPFSTGVTPINFGA